MEYKIHSEMFVKEDKKTVSVSVGMLNEKYLYKGRTFFLTSAPLQLQWYTAGNSCNVAV